MGHCLSKKQERPIERYLVKAAAGGHTNCNEQSNISPIAIQQALAKYHGNNGIIRMENGDINNSI